VIIPQTKEVTSTEETDEIARSLALILPWGSAVGLTGPLGAGKTFMVRAMVAALGGNREEVASPSYTLQYEYTLPDGRLVEHWDLYRLTHLPEELLEPISSKVIRVIEWWEKFPELLPLIEIQVEIGLLSDEGRRITVK
jgi:tRNA threonylcarbamoyladenosine biosynthesis protein TsaE